jgi:adenosylhomocysteine nucleosidase
MSLIVVTGLAAEARIAIAADVPLIVGAGRADRLATDLESAIAVGARRLLSFGVAGALSPRLLPGDLVVAHGVRHGAHRLSCDPTWHAAICDRLQRSAAGPIRGAPSAPAGDLTPTSSALFRYNRNGGWRPIIGPDGPCRWAEIAGVDAPIADAAEKGGLWATTGSVAVDMESTIVAQAARRHSLPFAILRVIADPASRPLPDAALVAMRADGEIDIAALLGALLRDPSQLPALLRLALDSRNAFAALVRVRALLGPRFASFNL